MTDSVHMLVGHILIFLTTVAGFVFQWLREGRRHKWQNDRFQQMSREIKKGQDSGNGIAK